MLNSIIRKLDKTKGKRESLREELLQLSNRKRKLEKKLDTIKKAHEHIQLVAQQTQQELEYSLSEPVSLAMGIVFDDPYELKLRFGSKRRGTDCKIVFMRSKKEFNPMSAAGGGTGNIAAFSLRPAIQSIAEPKPRPLFILDEPFPGLKGQEANERVLKMVKVLCKEFDIQILMISDERVSKDIIKKYADRIFETRLINGVTEVKTYG